MVTDGFIVDHVDQLLADQCLHIHIDDIGLHLAKKMLIVKKMISKFNKLAISSVHCTVNYKYKLNLIIVKPTTKIGI